jgi:hypothetical protein
LAVLCEPHQHGTVGELRPFRRNVDDDVLLCVCIGMRTTSPFNGSQQFQMTKNPLPGGEGSGFDLKLTTAGAAWQAWHRHRIGGGVDAR